MSGYLGALQRMAAAPASSGTGSGTAIASAGRREPRATPGADDALAWDAGMATASSQSGPAGDGEGGLGSPPRDAMGDSHAAAQTTGLNATTRTPGAAQNPSPVGSAPVTALPALQRPAAPDLTRHGMDDSVHPAIQAALRWVRGDQSAASDDADRAAQRLDSSNAAAEANSHSERMSSALARSTPAALVPSHGLPLPARAASFGSPPSGSPSQARSELAHKLVQDFALDFDLADSAKPLRAQSRSARADRDSAPMNHDAAAAASASTDRVEISIGSIHVKVDAAAPPRSQTLPAPAPQRPAVTPAASHAASQAAAHAAAQAAMHSAFSRSRLPR